MSWVALDRGIRGPRRSTWALGPAPALAPSRGAIYEQVMQAGWSDARQAFVQHSAADVLDVALPRMTAVSFI